MFDDLIKQFPEKYQQLLKDTFASFQQALGPAMVLPPFEQFLRHCLEQIRAPHQFEPYHQKLPEYYQFALDFFRPFIEMEKSKVLGLDVIDTICSQLAKGENAVFFANHQTESDPQAIALLLEKTHPQLAGDIIYVAGERVVTDPMAIPFSLGTNILCVYSKRYAQEPEKRLHNVKTMVILKRLLEEGGKAIYVAPSGGRDRKNDAGQLTPAPFDPNSTENFMLMARKAKTSTHFYPLALNTYNLLPPPEKVQTELGEKRTAGRTPIHLAFGPECDMIGVGESKEEQRKSRADKIWNTVCELYQRIK